MIALQPRQYVGLAAIAEREAGLHMPESKMYFVASRLQRRLRATGLADFDAYLALLRRDGPEGRQEVQALVSALTTNVTEAFREAHHFEIFAAHLRARLLPSENAPTQAAPPVRRHRDFDVMPHEGSSVRVRYLAWSAGCSTGEEPLSMAAVCHAVLGHDWTRHIRILATDVDFAVLDAARDRRHDTALARQLQTLPPGICGPDRHPPLSDPIEWMRSLHAGITVMRHNLLQELDLPGRFDAIFCRNVTIYFNREAQEKVHGSLCARLAPDGLLALGHSERLFVSEPGLVPAGRTAFRRMPCVTETSPGKALPCH